MTPNPQILKDGLKIGVLSTVPMTLAMILTNKNFDPKYNPSLPEEITEVILEKSGLEKSQLSRSGLCDSDRKMAVYAGCGEATANRVVISDA